MADIAYVTDRPRSELVASILKRTSDLDRSLRVVAEGILGAGSTIDLVAVDADGRAVLVMICEAGDDLGLFTRAIAERSWVSARIPDWLQLAPGIGLAPDSAARVILLAPSFSADTIAATSAFDDHLLALYTYRWVENGSAAAALIEPLVVVQTPRAQPPQGAESMRGDALPPLRGAAQGAATGRAGFRTGLTDEDLNLTASETRDFD